MLGNPMEQIPLDFGPTEPAVEKPAESEVKLETLDTAELEKRYHEKVGYDPTHRFLDRTEDERRSILIEGIQDPVAGKDRLGQEDMKDDQDAANSNAYWRK